MGFVQLFFGPHWHMNKMNKNPNIAFLIPLVIIVHCISEIWTTVLSILTIYPNTFIIWDPIVVPQEL